MYVLMYGVWAGFFTRVIMYGQWPDLRGAWGRPANVHTKNSKSEIGLHHGIFVFRHLGEMLERGGNFLLSQATAPPPKYVAT